MPTVAPDQIGFPYGHELMLGLRSLALHPFPIEPVPVKPVGAVEVVGVHVDRARG